MFWPITGRSPRVRTRGPAPGTPRSGPGRRHGRRTGPPGPPRSPGSAHPGRGRSPRRRGPGRAPRAARRARRTGRALQPGWRGRRLRPRRRSASAADGRCLAGWPLLAPVPRVPLGLPGRQLGCEPRASVSVAPLVVLGVALERAAVGDVRLAAGAPVAEVGLVPDIRRAGEVLERDDTEVVTGLAIRALIETERLADLLPGDPLAAGVLGVLAADAGGGVRQHLGGPDARQRLRVPVDRYRAGKRWPLADLGAAGFGDLNHGLAHAPVDVAGRVGYRGLAAIGAGLAGPALIAHPSTSIPNSRPSAS